jgi:flagellar hook-basal body complex protein FliE
MIPLVPSIVSSVAAAAAGAGISALSGPTQSPAAATSDGSSFGQMLDQLSSNAVDALRKGEAAAISGVQGKASVQEAVDAIMSAERTLHTAIAVRDKAVGAYQELSRMAI